MAENDRTHWDSVYGQRAGRAYPPPDALLVAYAPPLAEGSAPVALDVAAGLGQNALWLAARGYRVRALDISAVALARGRAEMLRRGLSGVDFVVVDLEDAAAVAACLPPGSADLICCFRYLNRALFPALRMAVRPGGLVIYQTYNVRRLESRAEMNRAYLLEPGELAGFFPGWEVWHNDEVGDLSRFVGRRPGNVARSGGS